MVEGIGKSAQLLKILLFGRKPTAASGSLRLCGAVAAFAALGSLGSCGSSEQVRAGPPEPHWLEQNWTPEIRAAYHHASQGTLTLPIPTNWFMALERADGRGLLSDSAYLDTFGFIASPRGPDNPLGLPIGLTRTQAEDPRNGRPLDRIGFTCAACHTGRIEHDGNTIVIDGAPALTNLGEFREQIGESLKRTLRLSVFNGFADRVVGPGDTLARRQARRRLYAALVITAGKGLVAVLQKPDDDRSIEEGFGRLDAINRIGNQVFGDGMQLRRNLVPMTAPVAYPHIWDTSWFDWVQYNGSIQQPMVRNAGEAMGVGAVVNYTHGHSPRFTSTIPVRMLHDAIESRLAGRQPTQANGFTGLRSPAWPENLLGAIDRPLADRGAVLYRENCQSCHLPAPNTPEFWTSGAWRPLTPADPLDPPDQLYLRLNVIPVSRVGTDPAMAQGMADRTVWVPVSLGLTCPAGATCPTSPDRALRRFGFGDALGQLVELVANRWYDANNVPLAERRRLNGNRPNGLRTPIAYKARPLNGIWATAPFLHNGSVPTLWALLSPYGERPPSFQLGNRQFDPQNVGYVNGGAFTLNTALAGNRNTGHLFEGPPGNIQRPSGTIGRALSPDERRALIEYLKTL